jgi:type VI secretion system protein ImpL
MGAILKSRAFLVILGLVLLALLLWFAGPYFAFADHKPLESVVARLVAILEHSWTPAGIVAWFHRPRRDLGGRTPLAVLSRRNPDEEALVSAARAGRSMYAT